MQGSETLRERLVGLPREQRVDLMRRLIATGVDLKAVRPPVYGTRREYPLSPGQTDLWVAETLYPSGALNLCGLYRFRSALAVDRLQETVDALRRRHEVLASTFRTADDGRPQQIRGGVQELRMVRHDWRGPLSGSAFEEVVRQQARRPFDLAADGAMRASHYQSRDGNESALLLAFHHLVTDWWAFDLIHRDFAALFARTAAETHVENAVNYFDLTLWQNDLRDSGAWDADVATWEEYLSEPPGPLFEHPPVESDAATQVAIDFARVPLDLVRSLAADLGVTVFSLLFAAFAGLLWRLAGQDEFIVGTPSANRHLPGSSELVGYVMNVLPVRVGLSSTSTLPEVARSIQSDMRRLLPAAHVPLGAIETALNVERVAGRAPLVQAVYMYLPEQETMHDLPGDVVFRKVHSEHEENDLVVVVRESAGRLSGVFEFRSDLFDVETVAGWAEVFAHLLEVVVQDPSLPLRDVPLLSAEAVGRVVGATNSTRAELPALLVHEMFEAQVALQPQAAAVVVGDQSLSYAELNARANSLASHLRGLGVGPEVMVGICMRRGLYLYVAVLAVLKAGGAYVPLDPDYPTDRVQFMVEDSGLRLVLAEAETRGLVEDFAVEVVETEQSTETALRAGAGVEDVSSGVTASNLAYVIYTSGSTGTPKGVCVEHRGLPNLVTAQAEAFGLTPQDRVLQFASLNFDASTLEMLLAWTAGATLLASNLKTGPGPRDQVVAEGTTFVLGTPSLLATLDLSGCETLRVVASGGEYLPADLSSSIQHGRTAFNEYGPTEATVVSTSRRLESGSPAGSVGWPLPNVRVYVLDGQRRPVPFGVRGEIAIGGVGVARGYLNRPELTAERFVPDPFGGVDARMYLTGDVGSVAPDGSVFFHGRQDHQVKVRGFRVELAEVEVALECHPAVDTAVVVARGEGAEKRLVAYVRLRDGEGQESLTSRLREWLRVSLPDYMVPSVFVALGEFPLSPAGKVDRLRLPEPSEDRPDLGEALVAPRDERERALAQIWSDVLGIDQVGVHDNFFELGGTSFALMEVLDRWTPVDDFLDLERFYKQPTIETLVVVAPGPPPQVP